MDYVIISVFILDLALNFRTTYFAGRDVEVVEFKKIAVHYVSHFDFYVDLLTSLPVYEIMTLRSQQQSQLKLLNLFKILRIIKFQKIYRNYKLDDLQLYTQMLEYIFTLFILTHLITCIWYYMNYLDSGFKDNQPIKWIPQHYSIINSDDSRFNAFYDPSLTTKFNQYIFTMYAVIMAILGGDVIPITSKQHWVIIVVLVGGQLGIFFFIAKFTIVMQKIYFLKTQFVARRQQIQKQLHEQLGAHKAQLK